MNEFLTDYKSIILAVHLLGVALGLGGATITDFTFFRALKDKKISDDELNIMHGLTYVIWGGVFLLVTSGVLLFLPSSETLLDSAKFYGKMLAVLVVIVNGILLGAVITPKLQQFDFTFKSTPHKQLHKLSFSLGAVSASSWYSAFIHAFVPAELDVHPLLFVGIYVGILVSALIGGQALYLIASKASKRTNGTLKQPSLES